MYQTYLSTALTLHNLLDGKEDYDMLPVYYMDLKKNPTMDLTPGDTIHRVQNIVYPDGNEVVYKKDTPKNVYLTVLDILLGLDKVCEEFPLESSCHPIMFTFSRPKNVTDDEHDSSDNKYDSIVRTIIIAEYTPYMFQEFTKNEMNGMGTHDGNARIVLLIGS